ncbi:hypothetical protein GCM10018793_26880 [Streptomyces sulfonofaciens]|uniref:Ricin B lectin domain-containing protein n=1 Tax=Streptomyces sulfonofaciens TaxID=68272 RepID=A0A919G5T2_9ACTN|nr:RICIN domain-containing protein [Streptomyces sulfonofaciens]GHH77835.1 hypothetical protein GCM10018793_26880 [Streptomyces sulfonofaciens]
MLAQLRPDRTRRTTRVRYSAYRRYPAFIAAGLLILTSPVVGLQGEPTASAPLPYGPDTCRPGLVWREATPQDHVCVNPDVRRFTRIQTQEGEQHRDPQDRTYGPDTCRPNFVWREATPDDHTCVAPQVREAKIRENIEASRNWEATNSKTPGRYDTSPFVRPDEVAAIRSAYSGRDDLVIEAQPGRPLHRRSATVQKRGYEDIKRFRFVRRGNAAAYQNAFQIMNIQTGLCLSVAGGRTGNGDRVLSGACNWHPSQTWYLQRRDDDRWQIRAMHSEKCLDAHNPALDVPPEGTYLQQWDCLGGKNQAWLYPSL